MRTGSTGAESGERDDFKLIEPDEFLPWTLGKPGAGNGHRLQCAAEALAALERSFGDALHPAIVARKEADDQVGLMDRPGAQDHRF